ncbi:MAG: tRNA dihydrouridine synthase DusB [Lachnospirales bacterium]
MKIGNIELENNVVLAPMAGISDLPYRLIAKEMGAGLVYSELISAKGIYYNNKNTKDLLKIHPKEQPIAIQVFGSEPKIMGEVAAMLNDQPFDILDLNMGCPVPKVVKNGEGSCLMRKPELAGEIIKEMVKNSKKPVTVKIRKGFNNNEINAVEIAKIAEYQGASLVAVHGRTREEYYSGKADWSIIKKVRENVKIPVLGNGDVVDEDSAKAMLDYTNCHGVMIGRGAEGNPFIFREIVHFLKTGEKLPKATVEEKIEIALKHAKMLIEYKGEYIAIREMRKHIGWYTKSMYGSTSLRVAINKAETYNEIEHLLKNGKERQ